MIFDLLILFLLAVVLSLGLYLLKLVRRGSERLHRVELGQRQLQDTLEGMFPRTGDLQEGIKIARHRSAGGLFDQLESYLYLRDRLDLREGLPYTRDWSASPDFLKLIVEHCLDAKPKTILECSSGLTTLMLARCCQINGSGKVYSLENGEEFADRARTHIERYGLSYYAKVIHAPLSQVTVNGQDYQWYAMSGIPESSIEMLVIDGPPGNIQKNSRYPALPQLIDRLAEGCMVFMDDAAREDEREIAALWQQCYPKIKHEYLKTERGCSVFAIRKA